MITFITFLTHHYILFFLVSGVIIQAYIELCMFYLCACVCVCFVIFVVRDWHTKSVMIWNSEGTRTHDL